MSPPGVAALTLCQTKEEFLMSVQASRSGAWASFVVVLVLVGPAGPSLGQDKQPKALPQPIIETWTQAGATAGWLRQDFLGFVQFFPASAAPRTGDVPGFRIAVWREGVVAELPPPQQPFGLDLTSTQVTDAGLKELAG